MKQDIKAKWVDALRSGDYNQGINVLHNPDTNEYCCLGVLCDLALREGVVSNTEKGISLMSTGVPATYYDGEAEFLPTAVSVWAGLPSTPCITAPTVFGNMPMPLPDINDVNRMTFDQIANLIESYL